MCRSSDSGKQPMIQWVQGLTVWKTQAITNGENMQMYAANACQHAYAIHIHTHYTHTHIYIYTDTAFLGIHMIKPLCKTVSKKKYIYIKQKQYYMQIWQLWFLIWRLRRDKAVKWQKIGTVCLGTAEEPKHSPMTQLVGVENSHPNPLKSPLQVPLMVCHHPPRPSKYW